MASNFTFPPPPPPPVKSVQPNIPQYTHSHRGGRGRGGFDRGRGRGRGAHARGGFGGHHAQNRPSPLIADGQFQTPQRALPQGGGAPSSADRHVSKKPRGDPPPSVPSFGAPLPSLNPTPASSIPAAKGQTSSGAKRKRTSNQLGLTPQEDDVQDSDEEADEEAAFTGFQGGLKFEHRGKVMALNTPHEIKVWIEERKKKWPTNGKVDERNKLIAKAKQEQAEALQQKLRQRVLDSQRTEQERRRKMALEVANKVDITGQSALEREQEKNRKLRQKLERSERKLAGQTEEPAIDGDVDNEQGSASSGSDSSSDVSSEETDSESSGAPEEETSKVAQQDQVPEQPETAPEIERAPKGVCSYFLKGHCRAGRRCRYKHERAERPNAAGTQPRRQERGVKAGRKTLYQRLVEQEEAAEDRVVLEAIKWLGAQTILGAD